MIRVNLTVACVAAVSASLWAPDRSVGAPKDAQTAGNLVEQVSALAAKCLDEREPIDAVKLIKLVEMTTTFSAHVDSQGRGKLVHYLGRILVHDSRKIRIPIDRLPGRYDPRERLKDRIVSLFLTLKDKEALAWLSQYVRVYGHRLTTSRLAKVGAVIKELGGTVPTPAEVEKQRKAQEARRRARKLETERLLGRLGKEKLDGGDVSRIIRRLGELGDRRAVGLIIRKIKEKDVHWIVKQHAMYALGRLGGRQAQKILVAELARPMPAKAKLADYGEVEAMIRSRAAWGLGRCGDGSVAGLLERLAADSKQYLRVRQACGRALGRLRSRIGTKPSATSKPTRPRVVSDEDRALVRSFIAKLESKGLKRDEKTNLLRALGLIGGPEARAFLVKVLEKAMPAEADLANDNEEEALFRRTAARFLGRCADASAVKLLRRLAEDPKQYRCVRRRCQRSWQEALGRLRRRLKSER